MRRINENGIRSEQDLRTHVTKRMQDRLRSSMHITECRYFNSRRKIRVMVGIPCSVGLVQESIRGDIFHNIRVVDCRSKVLKRHR